MTTVSISLDEQTKKDLDALAKKARVSRSDIIRDMFARYRLQQTVHSMQETARPKLQELRLETEDDIVGYINRKSRS